jgi:hypothetical protein
MRTCGSVVSPLCGESPYLALGSAFHATHRTVWSMAGDIREATKLIFGMVNTEWSTRF